MDLSFERTGSGPPLLLLHGLGASKAVWRPLLDRLAPERDLIAPDLPGFGASPPLPAGTAPTAAGIAAALATFCERLGAPRPHVAGNSLGAWIALEMAKAGAARSVCAISPAGLWCDPLEPRRVDRQRAGRMLRPLVRAMLRTRRGRARLLASTAAFPDRLPAADARIWVLDYLNAPAYAATSREMRAGAFEHGGRIDVPVTIVWGEGDRTVGRPSRRRLPPGVGFSVREGWGHTPTWDDPDGVAELLLEASAAEE